MQYTLNHVTNVSDIDISAINFDSNLQINQLGTIQTILDQDNIALFRHVRNTDKHIQYKGNLTDKHVCSLFNQYHSNSNTVNVTNYVHKALVQKDTFDGYKSIIYNKFYSNFHDTFLFDIHSEHYSDLSFSDHLRLHEKLEQLIDLIYLNTTFTMKICMPKSSLLCKLPHHNDKYEQYAQIKSKYKLTDNEMYYLNIIAISGSSKEVAKAIDKSPRTIEKMISTLCKKLKIQNKFSLQLMAKILASNAGITRSYISSKPIQEVATTC